GVGLNKERGDNTAVEIIRRMNAETCCLVQQQGVVRHEEERAGIVICRVVVPPELVALDLCDRLSVQVEHGFVMCLQRLAEPREVKHDDAIRHGNRPPSRCQIRGGRCGASEIAFFVQRAYPSGKRARSHERCRGPFKAGLCRAGRDDWRQSQVREAYVTFETLWISARSCPIPGGLKLS